MKETTLTQLKILVERAVRPVRASTSRMRKMREELLAHVIAVFEEEAARLGGESAALARTEQRFGDPAELTRQLQEAVPASDRFNRVIDRVWIWLIIGFAYALGAVFGSVASLYVTEYPDHVLVWVGSFLAATIAALGASLKNTKGPRERTFVIRASLLCLILVIAFLTGMLLIPGWYRYLLWIPFGILFVFGLLCWNHVQSRLLRQESGESAEQIAEADGGRNVGFRAS